jgi:hypothetical protein
MAQFGHTAVLAAVGAELTGRRGPGMPGSAQSFPGVYASPAAGFASGKPLDAAPHWPRSWRMRPGTTMLTRARPMMSCSG